MTAPPVSTSKLQMCRFADVIISAFVSLHLRNCTLLHVYFPSVRPVDQLRRQATGTQGLTLIGTVKESWYMSQVNQIGIEQC